MATPLSKTQSAQSSLESITVHEKINPKRELESDIIIGESTWRIFEETECIKQCSVCMNGLTSHSYCTEIEHALCERCVEKLESTGAKGSVSDESGKRQKTRKRSHSDSFNDVFPPEKVTKSKFSTFNESRAGNSYKNSEFASSPTNKWIRNSSGRLERVDTTVNASRAGAKCPLCGNDPASEDERIEMNKFLQANLDYYRLVCTVPYCGRKVNYRCLEEHLAEHSEMDVIMATKYGLYCGGRYFGSLSYERLWKSTIPLSSTAQIAGTECQTWKLKLISPPTDEPLCYRKDGKADVDKLNMVSHYNNLYGHKMENLFMGWIIY
ncbi:hypothetical protein M3P05_13710 [Sansalvadorimonas sp. 2012CJ34-2]|uniref:C2H2-type domain-containing protein n=1 Tax=Parendozoicomonas callyspongiae TaxID=2942213 RepID=A0ABT0PJS8_9GAMM|nr:hypothetical protein [Sansalvadorimonas sp. 2012CJ34-2]MCL6270982.1 hypothetical protein [Sansalvadorimonas sp. 2012CJ34-2]